MRKNLNMHYILTCNGGIASIVLLLLQKSSFLSSFTELSDVVLSYKTHTYLSRISISKIPALAAEMDDL